MKHLSKICLNKQ